MNDPVVIFKDGAPYSSTYEDIYYSQENGLEEARHVFLTGSNLPAAWQGRSNFVVAETGFGTGLNFLAAWQLWSDDAAQSGNLHYISIESCPLNPADIHTAHRLFPQLKGFSDLLLAHYPTYLHGMHRIWLDNNRVCLTLCFTDIADALTSLSCSVDAWFLDGFAPSKNPEMWSENVMQGIAKLSHPGTTLATFTAAGIVKRGLETQGFKVSKIKGFGRKREMITAILEDVPTFRNPAPWFDIPLTSIASRRAVVIGGGIAGSQAAWHLAERGWQVVVIERNEQPGCEASGNPAAVIAPKVTSGSSLDELFSLQCYGYQLHQLNQLGINQSIWKPCGVLHLAHNAIKRAQWRAVSQRSFPEQLLRCISQTEASAVAGIELHHNAIYYPQGGWIKPKHFIDLLLQHRGIEVIQETCAIDISSTDGGWVISDKCQRPIAQAKTVIIASGSNLDLECIAQLPLTPVQGQTSFARATNSSALLKTVVQHDGYITPSIETHHLLGSTYKRNVDSAEFHSEADRDNLYRQQENLGTFADSLVDISSAHSAVRVTTRNRMPMIGPIADETELRRNFRPMLRRNFNPAHYHPSYFPGLFYAGAYGSRGMTTAALGAELLASQICGEPLPLQNRLSHGVHPARYIIRALKRA